jgi:hypothetical protein
MIYIFQYDIYMFCFLSVNSMISLMSMSTLYLVYDFLVSLRV